MSRHKLAGAMSAKLIFLIVAFNAVALSVFFVTIDRGQPSESTFLLPEPKALEAFVLEDHLRQPFTPGSFAGKWTFVFFGFTSCPDICPVTLAVLRQAEDALRARAPDRARAFQVVLVTVDPERDTPEALARYVGAFSERFVGVTGELDALARFAKQLHVAFEKAPDGEGGYSVDHSGHIAIVDPGGRHHGFIKMPHNADDIAQTFLAIAD